MHKFISLFVFAFLAVLAAGCQAGQLVFDPELLVGASDMASEQTPQEAAIQNAMAAAPAAIAENAGVVDWPSEPGGELVTLRPGSNDWTCLPDRASTPANDPMCLDPTWSAWLDAYLAGAEPDVTELGISYMLAGGGEASNTDPYATQPAEGEDWMESPPHVMFVTPGGFDTADFTTDPTSGEPWIMWEGTPYEHLMVPVVPAAEPTAPVAITAPVEAKLKNIMGAAPAVIAEMATVMDWPKEPGGEKAMLREGANEWLCVPDWPATPDNDPMCFDPTWTEWMGAFMTGSEPETSRLGVSYMLAGGEYADATDPFAMEPPAGEDWVRPGPHVMLVAPGGFETADFTTDHTTGDPWLVWEGTPYEFLIVPVE